MSQIHITDGQKSNILDYITAKDIIGNDIHKKSLENTLETYQFITFADKRFSEFLEKRNRIIIPDEDGTLVEFVISEAHKYKDSEGYKAQVFANASYLELKKAQVIKPGNFTGSASQHLGFGLNDSGWRPGIVEVAGNLKLDRENHTNPYEYIKRLSREFEGEPRFRIEHDGNKITGRYVDLLVRVGMWRGREVEFGKDLDGIRRVEKQDIVTALLGLGPEDEEGNQLEVLVEDNDALQRWGRLDEHGNLNHLIEPYEIQSTRGEMTETEARQYTRTALNKRIDTQVTYETTIVDLENVPGMENKKIRFGDTIKIKDTKFNPPLYLEARVFEQDRSIKSKGRKLIKLGDYIEHTEEEVNAIWHQMQAEIRNRLERLVLATVVSSAGAVFKNGIGSTELEAKTFLNGFEVDEEGTKYEYRWHKFDKNGDYAGFSEDGKSITVNASSIDEKATYRVEIILDDEVLTLSEVTLSNVFDGEEGKPGSPGKDGDDGVTTYMWTKYADNVYGVGMSDNSEGKRYLGVATNKTTEIPSNNPSDYTWTPLYDNVVVGGRNLISVNDFQIVNHLLTEISTRGEVVDNKTFKIYANPPNGSAFLFKEISVAQGEEYVLNADMSDTISSLVGVTVYDKIGNILEEDGLLSGDFNFVSSYRGYQIHSDGVLSPPYYFKVVDERVGYVRARLGIYRGNLTIRDVVIRDSKLEKGNIATDWTPAPEDTEAEIEKAMTTADGKNTVIHLDSEPSIVGRIIGDVWFDTSDGYKMYRFNGTSWISSQFGENAIVKNSITANHIKSLAGLNVNDQFIVDENGKLTIGNDRVTIDDVGIQIKRPDGAVAISDGLTHIAYGVTGNDPNYMTAGRVIGSGVTFMAFIPAGSYVQNAAHIYGGIKGSLDGRGIDGSLAEYENVRDNLGAVAFQQYRFVHSARYLVFDFRKYGGSKFSVHVVNGASDSTDDRIFFQLLETDVAGLQKFVVDLGTPTFNARTVTFKVGWTQGWGDRMENMRFIMESVHLTDFI